MTDKLKNLAKQSKYEKVQNWLDSKIEKGSNYKFDSKYAKNNIYHILDFYNYYCEDDQDMTASDHFYIDMLRYYRKNDPDAIDKDDNIFIASIIEERYIKPKKLDNPSEEEWTTVGTKKNEDYLKDLPDNLSVLIPPNTNRFKVNELLKKTIDYCIDNDLSYGNFNTSKSMEENMDPDELIFNRDMKNDFYEFCYKNKSN